MITCILVGILVGIFWTILLFGLIIWNIYDHIIRLDKQNKEQQLFINELIERSKSQLDISNGVLDCLQNTVNTFKKEIKDLKDTFTILKLAKQYGIEVVDYENRTTKLTPEMFGLDNPNVDFDYDTTH